MMDECIYFMLHTSTTTELNIEKNIMKTQKNIGKAMGKKFKN